jgi:chemotaxis protein methyltransferase CheR
MQDAECVALLRWALPRLGLGWPGFRKVRRQVCKRITRRVKELGLADAAAYRERLERAPEEWPEIDALCRITISRFYRDRGVFDHLGEAVLPALATAAVARGERTLRCWSAGSGSGEEPFSLAILWAFRLAHSFPRLSLAVVATDADEQLLERAARGCYPRGTLRELPSEWIRRAFVRDNGNYCLRPAYRESVLFLRQDIRSTQPEGLFDLVLCRNVVFTYFETRLQRRALAAIAARMRPGAALVVGKGEALPDAEALEASPAGFGVYWKAGTPSPTAA